MQKKQMVIIIVVSLLVGSGLFWSFPKLKNYLKQSSSKTVSIDILEKEAENLALEPAQLESQNLVQEGVPTSQVPQNEPSAVAEPEKPSPAQVKPKPENEPVAANSSSSKVISKLVAWGFQPASGRTIKAIIVHTSYNALGGDVFDFDKVIQEWKDAGVAPHYAIDRGGKIYQLVADKNIAWHAGASKLPDGTTDVNGVSLGIEVINSKEAKFTEAQYTALNKLIADLKNKYSIKYVLGHEQIAPGRKTDPWGIEWGKVVR